MRIRLPGVKYPFLALLVTLVSFPNAIAKAPTVPVVVPVVWQSDRPGNPDRIFWVRLPVRPGTLLCSASYSPQIKQRPVRLRCVRRDADTSALYDTYRFPIGVLDKT